MALAAALMLVSSPIVFASTDHQVRTVPLPGDRALLIEVTVGTIRIEGSDRTDAEIAIDREAPTPEAMERIPVTIDETASRVSVRVVQAGGATDPALRAEIVVRVPRAAVIERAQVMEGRVTIAGFAGRLTADVRRGPIEGADVSGTLRLETGIGSVVLTKARLSPGGLLRLRAFNGDVRLTLAERPVDARILALALNGHIKSEIPLTLRDTWGPRWGEATLGKGEPLISIDVVTGTVDLRSP